MAYTSLDIEQINRQRAQILKVADACDRAGYGDVKSRMSRCLTFGKVYECRGCGHKFKVTSYNCMHRLCPHCGKLRSKHLIKSREKLVKRSNLKHLVLTIKNVPVAELQGKTKFLRDSFTRLRHRQLFKLSWAGGITAVEFKYNGNKGWHIHLHSLIQGDYVPQDVISRAWCSATHGAGSVVWISRNKNSRETLKYILKPSGDLLDDNLALSELLKEISGRRMVAGWGCWHGYSEKKTLRAGRSCPNCGCTDLKLIDEWVMLTDLSPPGIDRLCYN